MVLELRSPHYANCVSVLESPTGPHERPRPDFPAFEEPVSLSEAYTNHAGWGTVPIPAPGPCPRTTGNFGDVLVAGGTGPR